MFSYGSGLAASMFSFTCGGDVVSHASLLQMQSTIDLNTRLQQRTVATPAEFGHV